MNTFLLISAAIVIAAILLLAPSLLRSRKDVAEDTREDNIRIARERLAEIEKEKERGDMSDEEFGQAKQDLEIALAQDLSTASSQIEKTDNRGTARLTLAIVAVAIPVIVFFSYQRIGTPQHLHVAGPGQPAVAQPQQQAPSISELVGELARRLEAEPNNPQGWFLLGRTYMKLDRYAEAVDAYENLNKYLPDNPSAMIALSDALAMNNGGQITDRGIQLLEKTLEIEPQAATALWLLGNAAEERGQDQQALDYWSRAFPLMGEEPGLQQELRARIAEVEQRSGLQADIPAPLPDIMAPAVSEPITQAPPATAEDGLLVEVALDAELFDQASANDSVFIYAKAAAGPPMPLAVARMRVADLPTKVALNDSMAMMPQMKLSSFERVLVGARVSKSGQAIPQSGDLQSPEVETSSNSNDSIRIVINQQRP